ncbi:hypothetical protein WICPIJ_003331 [Wickerhamomyces pijperi]|uniref:PWWP domain-containing protein n=1 Tax=Wickerhamomyces pijperi TaxID=599730 RepID=A0A9P8QA06_WICPI|nr:hypothetical protein WICPIJ_003331 [Wickerhamomyces pijperi]
MTTPYSSYKDIKPNKLVLVKWNGNRPWPCLTLHISHVSPQAIKDRAKIKSTRPIPVIFFGDFTFTWCSIDMLMPLNKGLISNYLLENQEKERESTLANGKNKDLSGKLLYGAYKDAEEVILVSEMTGKCESEILLRRCGLLGNEFINHQDGFGEWFDYVTKKENLQVRDLEKLKTLQIEDLEALCVGNEQIQQFKDKFESESIELREIRRQKRKEKEERIRNSQSLSRDSSPYLSSDFPQHSRDSSPLSSSAAVLNPNPLETSSLPSPADSSKMHHNSASDSQTPATTRKRPLSTPLSHAATIPEKIEPLQTESPAKEIKLPFRKLNPTKSSLSSIELEASLTFYRRKLQVDLLTKPHVPKYKKYLFGFGNLKNLLEISIKHERSINESMLRQSKIHKVLKMLLQFKLDQRNVNKEDEGSPKLSEEELVKMQIFSRRIREISLEILLQWKDLLKQMYPAVKSKDQKA